MTSPAEDHPEGRWRPRPHLRVLRIPAAPGAPAEVVWLVNRSTCFSDAIGGGNLDEAWQAPAAEPARKGDGYCVYLDDDRRTKNLAANESLAVVLARLGQADRDLVLAGDALITGLDPHGDDTHVPDAVLHAAIAGAVLPAGTLIDTTPRAGTPGLPHRPTQYLAPDPGMTGQDPQAVRRVLTRLHHLGPQPPSMFGHTRWWGA